MTDNPNVEKIGNGLFNLLMIDDWFIGLFRTNMEIWRFMEHWHESLSTDAELPKKMYVLVVVTKGDPPVSFTIVDKAMLTVTSVKQLSVDDPKGENSPPKDMLVYVAMFDDDPETEALEGIVAAALPQIIKEVFYDG